MHDMVSFVPPLANADASKRIRCVVLTGKRLQHHKVRFVIPADQQNFAPTL